MPSLGLKGPHDFDSETVDRVVTKTSEGNYALGYINPDGGFVPKYVGRSDTDLNQELKNRLNRDHPKFKYGYASSPKAAFEKECHNYHDFEEQLDNERHPARPDGSGWTCPVCSIFD